MPTDILLLIVLHNGHGPLLYSENILRSAGTLFLGHISDLTLTQGLAHVTADPPLNTYLIGSYSRPNLSILCKRLHLGAAEINSTRSAFLCNDGGGGISKYLHSTLIGTPHILDLQVPVDY